MRHLKIIFSVIFSILLAFSVIGCNKTNSNSQVITLKVWEDENNIDMLIPLADEFIADYAQKYPKAPTLKIVFEAQAEGSAVENINLYGEAGTAADIFAFIHDSLGVAVESGDIAKDMFPLELKATHEEKAISAFTINDQVYGYPITAESITIMYDKTKVTSEQLSSFENLKSAGKKLAWKTTSDAYYTFAFLTDVNLFGQNGNDKKQLNFNTPNAIDNLYNFVIQYKASIADIQSEEAISLLQSGEVAGIVSSPFLWATVKQTLGDNAAVAVLPTINGNTLTPFSGYKGYGVSSYTKYPHLAHAFASYLTNAENQYYRFVKKQLLPTVIDTSRIDEALNNDTQGKYLAAIAMKQSLENSVTMPNILAMGNYWAPMQDSLTAIWNMSGENLTKAKVAEQLQNATQTIKAQIS